MKSNMSKNQGKITMTTRGRYAVMAMTELAQKKEDTPVPLVEIAKSGNISLSYLEQLFAGLRRHHLVKSYRGPGGGYILARAAKDIKISEILHAAESCAPPAKNRSKLNLSYFGNQQTRDLWDYMEALLHEFAQHVSLEDVILSRLDAKKLQSILFEKIS